MRYIVSTPKAVISGLSILFFWGYACLYFFQASFSAFLLFAALGGIFAWQFYKNASYVVIDETAIRLLFCGFQRRCLSWDSIQEMGVIGEAVFSRVKKKGKRRSGEKFIYFSTVAHNAQSRFQMVVNWPPKQDTLYIEYTPAALEKAHCIWNRPIKYYNVEDLYPNTED